MPRSPHPNSAEHAHHGGLDGELLAARRVAGAGWAIIAELGRRAGGGAAFLARHQRTGELVAIAVSPAAGSEGGFATAIAAELTDAIPGPRLTCPECDRTIEGWGWRCACGTDLAGHAGDGPDDGDASARATAWLDRAVAGELEILGALPVDEGRGVVRFGRRLDDGAIVALRLCCTTEGDDDEPRYVLATSAPMPTVDGVEPVGRRSSPLSGPVHFTPVEDSEGVSEMDERERETRRALLELSGLGSGLLARQPTPEPDKAVPIPRVCPQCGGEYDTASRFCPNDGSPLRPKVSADPLIGTVIAERYQVLRRIGEGGMGRVYLAEHVKMNRQCALKVMSAQLLNDVESAQRFAREASNAARIIHPNVAAVFDYGESDGLVYLVMEYVEGEPLSRLIERERVLPPHRALDIARQVTEALAAAHELGIVHRDLKPDNILVARNRAGREIAKVVDFGIAKAMQEPREQSLTRTGLVIGTPEYMSPEQLLGDPVDARSDIYSLGCILYQMLTGVLPFDATTREQIVKKRLSEAAPHPKELAPDLPEALDHVVVHMLARSPAERYRTTLDLREALDPVATLGRDWDPAAYRTPRSTETVLLRTSAEAPTEKLDVVAATTERRRQRRRAAIGGGVGLAAMGLVAGILWTRPKPAASEVTPASSSAVALPPPGVTAVPDSMTIKRLAQGSRLGAKKGATASAKGARKAAADTQHVAAAPTPVEPTPSPRVERVSEEQRALRAPLERYAEAIQSGNIERVRSVYPAMVEDQARLLNDFLLHAEQITDSLAVEHVAQRGDSATVDFTVYLHYVDKNAKTKSNARLPRRADLLREGSTWKLQRLIDRDR